jgi:predicted nucleic acid-binding protein
VIVVDTSILVYAVGSEHDLGEPSGRLFDAVAEGRLEATSTVEVIQEFTHAFSRRRSRREAADRARSYTTLLAPLLASDASYVDPALDLFERHERLDIFDAFLTAAALDAGASALVSADAAFASLEELSHVAPGSAAFEELLAA